MNLIAVIPARIGSERIKEKNIKKFHGIPIVVRIIKILKETKLFSKIYVSTESNKIINLLKKNSFYNILVRPKELSSNDTVTQDVILNAISNINYKYNDCRIMCVYPTSIFINKNIIKKSIKLLKKNKNSFIFVAQKFTYPIEKAFYLKNKKLKFFKKKFLLRKTQSTNEFYHDAGLLYLANKKTWKNKKILSEDSKYILLSRNQSCDINYLEDWNLAEDLYKLRNNI